MAALTVRQPWASLIVTGHKEVGYKNVENRTWCPPKSFAMPGLLAIHASKADSKEGMRTWGHLFDPASLPRQTILGTVRVEKCITTSKSVWAEYARPGEKEVLHWVLSHPVKFRTPVPASGKLGVWKWYLA